MSSVNDLWDNRDRRDCAAEDVATEGGAEDELPTERTGVEGAWAPTMETREMFLQCSLWQAERGYPDQN